MLVPIKDIKPNPYRDFELYPYDEEQIENLMESYRSNGDFGVLPARSNGTGHTYELAAGHHRLEAMRRLKLKDADLKVGDYDEDQMINIMVDENSKQMGQNSAAFLDSVCAAIRRIAYLTLTLDHSAQLCRVVYPDGKHAFEKAREAIEGGRGVGRDVIARYLDGRLPTGKIETALATIKSSDLHLALINKVKERIEQERKEAEKAAEAARKEAERIAAERAEAKERARKEQEAYQRKIEDLERKRKAAEQAAKEAKERHKREEEERKARELAAKQKAEEEQRRANEELRRKREAEAEKAAREMEKNRAAAEAAAKQRRDAEQRASSASSQTKAKAPAVKFDTSVANLFKNDHQLELFRKIVTTGAIADILEYGRQRDAAKACIAWCQKVKGRITEAGISEWCSIELNKFMKASRNISKEQEHDATVANATLRIERAAERLRAAIVQLLSEAHRLTEEYGNFPDKSRIPELPRSVAENIPATIKVLERLQATIKKARQ